MQGKENTVERLGSIREDRKLDSKYRLETPEIGFQKLLEL
jgi:hypothetical protein